MIYTVIFFKIGIKKQLIYFYLFSIENEMKIKVFANTNKLHLLSRCSCHVLYQEIDLLAFALCYVDDFVLFKFYLFFIRVTDLIIFHANTDTIFFLIILKRFLYSTHFLLYMYHVFFLNNYSVIFFFL